MTVTNDYDDNDNDDDDDDDDDSNDADNEETITAQWESGYHVTNLHVICVTRHVRGLLLQ